MKPTHWESEELLNAALERADKAAIAEVLALVRDDGFERIDVEPLGGVGYRANKRIS